MKFITPEAMKALEEGAAEYGLGMKDLMENAGRGVAEFVLERFGTPRVCVVCGSGNNGGDGFVAARHMSKVCRVEVLLLTSPDNIRTEEARENWAVLSTTEASIHVSPDLKSLRAAGRVIAGAGVVVDAIFGTGLSGVAVREPYATAIRLVNESQASKVAVDVPSGLDPTTGEPGDPTVRAEITLALHLPKAGLKGRREFTGEIVVVPIGIREAHR